jgi:hypothetical protein
MHLVKSNFFKLWRKFTATNGPASGMTIPILELEASTAAVGTLIAINWCWIYLRRFYLASGYYYFWRLIKDNFRNTSDIVVSQLPRREVKLITEIVTVSELFWLFLINFRINIYKMQLEQLLFFWQNSSWFWFVQIEIRLQITGTKSSYNDQVQISPVSAVTNNGLPTKPYNRLLLRWMVG